MSIKATKPAQEDPTPYSTYTVPPASRGGAIASSSTSNTPADGYGDFKKPTPKTPFSPTL